MLFLFFQLIKSAFFFFCKTIICFPVSSLENLIKNPNSRQFVPPKDWTPEKYNTSLQIQSNSVNSFGSSLFSSLAKDDGNLFFSPLSIHHALAMTANGAAHETESVFKNVLRLHDLPEGQSVSSFTVIFHIPSLALNDPFLHHYRPVSC